MIIIIPFDIPSILLPVLLQHGTSNIVILFMPRLLYLIPFALVSGLFLVLSLVKIFQFMALFLGVRWKISQVLLVELFFDFFSFLVYFSGEVAGFEILRLFLLGNFFVWLLETNVAHDFEVVLVNRKLFREVVSKHLDTVAGVEGEMLVLELL